MAIAEINAAGGVMGKQVNAIVEDGASDPKTYNEKASKLVIENKLPTVFGSYTSASRKAVLPVFEKRNAMYFYPTYYGSSAFFVGENFVPKPVISCDNNELSWLSKS
jgi:urea transport system substrate-binding protein